MREVTVEPILTVVTASHRNAAGLRTLADEILPVLGKGLCWLIKDSGHCGETKEWAGMLRSRHTEFIFDDTSDSGIYDALNQALAIVKSHYYLVVGSDDLLDPGALTEVLRSISDLSRSGARPDVITFPVQTPKGIWRRKRLRPLWLSSSSLFTTHSVGTLIRRDLHDRLGMYDTRYRILADSLFLRQAWIKGARFEHRAGPILGTFNLDGVSSRDHGRRMIETYSYLASTGSPKYLQAALLWLRLLRYRPLSLL